MMMMSLVVIYLYWVMMMMVIPTRAFWLRVDDVMRYLYLYVCYAAGGHCLYRVGCCGTWWCSRYALLYRCLWCLLLASFMLLSSRTFVWSHTLVDCTGIFHCLMCDVAATLLLLPACAWSLPSEPDVTLYSLGMRCACWWSSACTCRDALVRDDSRVMECHVSMSTGICAPWWRRSWEWNFDGIARYADGYLMEMMVPTRVTHLRRVMLLPVLRCRVWWYADVFTWYFRDDPEVMMMMMMFDVFMWRWCVVLNCWWCHCPTTRATSEEEANLDRYRWWLRTLKTMKRSGAEVTWWRYV
jgi:hypothetical protein